MNVTHNTTDQRIEETKVHDLRVALVMFGYESRTVNKMKKSELIACVKGYRDAAQEEYRKEQEAKEQREKEQLKKEQNNEIIQAAFAAARVGINKEIKESLDKLKTMQHEITKSHPIHISTIMAASIETAMFEAHYLRTIDYARVLFSCEFEKQEFTVEDQMNRLQEWQDELTRSCIDNDYYCHNSSRESSSIENRMQHRAVQTATRFVMRLQRAFRSDLNQEIVEAVGRSSYVSGR